MAGGVIIGLTFSTREANRIVRVNVADCPHYPKHSRGDECPRPNTCCVYTDGIKTDGTIADLQVGDSFWWQQGWCYWTPKANIGKSDNKGCGVLFDIRMRKIGYSH